MLPYARNTMTPSPTIEATSPHLYRPRSTSLHYPKPARRRFRWMSWLPRSLLRCPRRLRSLHAWLTLSTLLLPYWFYMLRSGERTIYTTTMSKCEWESWERWPKGVIPHRAVLITDPQVVDPHTYNRRGLTLKLVMYYSDKYLKRGWDSIHRVLSPETVVFLGDLFDGGREWAVGGHRQNSHRTHPSEEYLPDPGGHRDWDKYGNRFWLKEYERFGNIYETPPGVRAIKSIPGNHDLGFGAGVKLTVRDRFSAYVGDLNQILDFGNHTFIAIDSVSLSNDQDPDIYGPAKDFLSSLPLPLPRRSSQRFPHTVATEGEKPKPESNPLPDNRPLTNSQPTVLLTHVPLYRAPDTPCGPLRERGIGLPIQYGYQYQTVLQPALSAEVLAQTGARWVFSGDDHDACEVEHHWAREGVVKETTIKSVSWTMGIRYPAVYLLSLYNPPDGSVPKSMTLQGKMCFLPDQLGVYIGYAWAGLWTIVVCALEVFRTKQKRRFPTPSGNGAVLPIATNGPRLAYGLTIDDDGGDGKYWKPTTTSSKRRVTGVWWWALEVGKEVASVGVCVAPMYLCFIWSW